MLNKNDRVVYYDVQTWVYHWATIKRVYRSTAVIDLAWAKNKRVGLKTLSSPAWLEPIYQEENN